MADKQIPRTENEFNLFIQNLAVKLPGFQAVLNLLGTDVDFVVKNAVNYQYLLNASQQISDAREAFTSFKRAIFEGEITDPVPAAPTFPAINPPSPLQTGIETEVRAIVKRIRSSAGYNDTIGEELGLVDSGPAPLNPNALTAEIKITAKAGSVVEIAFSKQGQDAMRVEFQRKGDTEWQLAGIFTSTPGTHGAPSVPPGDPESRQYRGVLLKKNIPIGNYSPIYTVVTTP